MSWNNELTGVDTDELRRLADAATRGPWHHGPLRGEVWNYRRDGSTLLRRIAATPTPLGKESDAAYIAAVSPDVVLRLLDVVDAARCQATGDHREPHMPLMNALQRLAGIDDEPPTP